MFVATANVADPIPAPLRDRMWRILEIPGYTRREKLAIARQHLIPKQIEEHGITPQQLEITDPAVEIIIDSYTREAGVRTLERQIASVIRGVAVKIAEGDLTPRKIVNEDQVREFLGGPQRYARARSRSARKRRASRRELAWTSVGGEILFIEATRMYGTGKLQLTGQLGDVMKESAHAALSYVRSNAEKFGVAKDFLEKSDVHIHIPAGGMPKDGPSAGVTDVHRAGVDAQRHPRSSRRRDDRRDHAPRTRAADRWSQGEGAWRRTGAGIKRVIVPERNKPDLDEVPNEVKNDLEFVFVQKMEQVLEAALEEKLAPKNPDDKKKGIARDPRDDNLELTNRFPLASSVAASGRPRCSTHGRAFPRLERPSAATVFTIGNRAAV